MKPSAYLFFILTLVLAIGLALHAPPAGAAESRGFMYEELDGITLYYIPQNTTLYRELLPSVFDMPDQPLVHVFVTDYYQMRPGTLPPYREVAVFLLCKYKGEPTWHCITMPVTDDRARLGGIRNLGYPKVMADITFSRNAPIYSGIMKVDGKTILEYTLDTKDHPVTTKEKEGFDRLTGIPSLNFLRGRLIDPVPAARGAKVSMLGWAQRNPDLFKVLTGKATLVTHPENAPTASDWRPKAFAIPVGEIVLAYYSQNKYGFSFGQIKPAE
jgi:hypothetical protein